MDQVHQTLLKRLVKSGIAKEWVPTPRQEILKVPPQLVYIAALSFLNEGNSDNMEPPFSAAVSQRFQDLLAVYQTLIQCPNMTFLLSPVLVPSKEQIAIVQDNYQEMLRELEEQSNEALQDLLQEQKTRSSPKLSFSKKTKGKNGATKAVSNPISQASKVIDSMAPESVTTKVSEKTLEELLVTQIGSHNEIMQQNDNENDESWVAVGKKTCKVVERETKEEDVGHGSGDRIEYGSTSEEPDTIVIETSTSEESGTSCVSGGTASYLRAAQQGTGNVQPANNSLVPGPESERSHKRGEIGALKERIVELEQQVAEKEHQLQTERLASAKTLRQQRESSDNLIQALQLRLYIADTRLKTYQDALEDHLQAVATNSHYQSSPARAPSQVQDVEHTKSPLISRVLMKQNRFES